MKLTTKLAAAALCVCVPLSAMAHHSWIMPSGTVYSGANQTVSFDASVSEDLFYADAFPLKIDTLAITAPDGSLVQPDATSGSKIRNTVDLKLTQQGTYKVAVTTAAINGSYKLDGQPRRFRGNADSFAKDVPANATDVVVNEMQGRVETFVTIGKPGVKALAPTGKGIELTAITHPNDVVAGENASFRLLLDGKPAAGVKVEATLGGRRYGASEVVLSTTTERDGKFSFKWPQAGMYLIEASVKDDKTSFKPAKERRASYSATLEVQQP